jgi:hypothetical protein
VGRPTACSPVRDQARHPPQVHDHAEQLHERLEHDDRHRRLPPGGQASANGKTTNEFLVPALNTSVRAARGLRRSSRAMPAPAAAARTR